MRRSFLLLALCGFSLLPAVAAKADTFTFTSAALGITESGTLTASNNGDGSFTATAISAPEITGLLDAGAIFGNDNLLFPSATRQLDVNGLGFTLFTNGQSYQVNLFSNLTGYEILALDSVGNLTDVPATFSVTGSPTVTPEPASLLLLTSGTLAMGATAIRRRKVQAS